jgi:hypothetical protein
VSEPGFAQFASDAMPVGVHTMVFSGAEFVPLPLWITLTANGLPFSVTVTVAPEKFASLTESDQRAKTT